MSQLALPPLDWCAAKDSKSPSGPSSLQRLFAIASARGGEKCKRDWKDLGALMLNSRTILHSTKWTKYSIYNYSFCFIPSLVLDRVLWGYLFLEVQVSTFCPKHSGFSIDSLAGMIQQTISTQKDSLKKKFLWHSVRHSGTWYDGKGFWPPPPWPPAKTHSVWLEPSMWWGRRSLPTNCRW